MRRTGLLVVPVLALAACQPASPTTTTAPPATVTTTVAPSASASSAAPSTTATPRPTPSTAPSATPGSSTSTPIATQEFCLAAGMCFDLEDGVEATYVAGGPDEVRSTVEFTLAGETIAELFAGPSGARSGAGAEVQPSVVRQTQTRLTGMPAAPNGVHALQAVLEGGAPGTWLATTRLSEVAAAPGQEGTQFRLDGTVELPGDRMVTVDSVVGRGDHTREEAHALLETPAMQAVYRLLASAHQPA